MTYAESVLDLIGNTPLVKLGRVASVVQATVLVKVEYLNPGGSSKDRIATRIIDAAERDGLLRPGGTIVEPTSGNTGVGLALVAQQRGYRCIFVLPDKVGEDKRSVLTAYGAEIVVTPTAVAPDDPASYYSVSDRLAREIPGAFKPNQYVNLNGPLSHYETTGPEIWRDTAGHITHFVAGVGTGGTISGVGRYLKEVSLGRIQIIGADPEGSVYSGGGGRPYLTEGVGEDFWPGAYDPSVVDRIITSSDVESFAMTRRLAREEGLLVGGSSGLAVSVALRAAAELGPDDVVVVLLPDGGRGYLGKIFNDRWMRSYGFLELRDEGTVRDVLRARATSPQAELPALVHAHPTDTVRDAIGIMTEYGVSQLPVLSAEPPVVVGEVVGAVDERDLLDRVFSGSTSMSDPLGASVGAPLALIGLGESIASARSALREDNALLVIDAGKPIAVMTRQDLLTYATA
ncbi:cystathionine beta-synthase [Rathayibacter toxicus]|uniref:Cystathionine beta-synthase n=1 Tax=Rathayibacter toxicus TaxID=145458 RepID=A0A0C5BTZ6_9MICO|nr:cystathionine beta-synthase [Rathayibacter toxicus]AJM78122.1 cystathionine beta-synthase [Rathayibacter toxicus]ALS57622.1 cystathionine beta-synthase [Rathayibacter toxicus]KKM45050.1 cystathionine beta-synthase [Rathayibacter toxicus]PPG20965.1 cystathionine beta-synthase [Rathayibacter toxicus]PPG46065.1 cystathionine beta-synthase [Rathayibacter toxicus]